MQHHVSHGSNLIKGALAPDHHRIFLMITKKICSNCLLEKKLIEFSTRKTSLDGYYGRCKSCVSKGKAKHYAKNKESLSDIQRKYRSENKEAFSQRAAKYYAENKKSFADKNRNYREKNKESIADCKRKYNAENKEAVADSKRKYRIENKENMAGYFRNYQKQRRSENPKFAMIHRISSRMRLALSAKGLTKTTKTMQALGCTSDQFQNHIELQFSKGMNWANRDKWHLDHIVPISSAETEEDVIRLSHYLNLRPLWAEENLSKSNKQTHLI